MVYYDRTEGDIIRHRMSRNGTKWSPHGWDMTVNDGDPISLYDQMKVWWWFMIMRPDFRREAMTTPIRWRDWSEPKPLTVMAVRSVPTTDATGQDLAYVFIGKPLGEQYRFQAKWRWFKDGEWSKVQSFSDGSSDAWHTNVERRPDGSVVAGFDIGTGGAATTLYFVEGSEGKFGELQNITQNGEPGERPHFAFADNVDYVTWFHKEAGQPKHIYVRSHQVKSNQWGAVEEPSKGYGGFHFDPEIEIKVVCCVDMGLDLNKMQKWYTVSIVEMGGVSHRLPMLIG